MKQLFDALDICEEILQKQRFLCGNTLTEPDIRLFVTLIRFDEVFFICSTSCYVLGLYLCFVELPYVCVIGLRGDLQMQ